MSAHGAAAVPTVMSQRTQTELPGGRFADNLSGFGRALRRAGLPVDAARMALAAQALLVVGVGRRADVAAALEAVLVCREGDRTVFGELFDAWFRESDAADVLTGDMQRSLAPVANARRARRHDAAAPLPDDAPPDDAARPDAGRANDAAMAASALERLRQADFNTLSASEFHRVQRLAREVRLPMPEFLARRVQPGVRGARLHWPGMMHAAVRHGGEILRLTHLRRRQQPVPLLVLVDVSGSMQRYARMLLAFLHGATRALRQRHLFAFGTRLTDLGPAMRRSDTDAMLLASAQAIKDFGGGTCLGAALSTLRQQQSHCLVGRRTLVLLISDGLDTGDPGQLQRELDWLRRHCARLLWLNPLLRFDGYTPIARGAAALHARAHGMLAVHNIAHLEGLAVSLAASLRR